VNLDEEVRAAAERIVHLLLSRDLMLASAESCTGGLIAAAVTDVPGSSAVLDRGFVTYSNEAKTEMLGVPASLIASHGAVSREVARAMAEGVLAHARAAISVSVTGIAGPGGGSANKPVGLVHFGAAGRSGTVLHREKRFGDLGRAEIRRRAVLEAFNLVEEVVASR
jgi:nicotinamide-nucleotide amidase